MEGKMRKNKFLVVSFSFLILVLLYGCATTSEGYFYGEKEKTIQNSLDVASILRFDDVPVPLGFKTLESESFAFQNDVTRVALLKYAGSRTPDQVVAFFKEQMPMYNWNPINIIEYEKRILNYEKDSESCIVSVESRMRGSIITIAVSPKSRPMKVEKDK